MPRFSACTRTDLSVRMDPTSTAPLPCVSFLDARTDGPTEPLWASGAGASGSEHVEPTPGPHEGEPATEPPTAAPAAAADPPTGVPGAAQPQASPPATATAEPPPATATKTCPECAEQVQAAAKVC